MASGRFGFAVADVGKGGNDNNSGVKPGMSRTTTFCTERGFYHRLALSPTKLGNALRF